MSVFKGLCQFIDLQFVATSQSSSICLTEIVISFLAVFFLCWHIRHLGCSSLEKRPWASYCADGSAYQPCAGTLRMSCLKVFFYFFKSYSKVEDIHFFLWELHLLLPTGHYFWWCLPSQDSGRQPSQTQSINDYVTALNAGKILLSRNIFEVIQPVSTSSCCVKWVTCYSVRV